MTVACAKWIITSPNTIIRGWSGSPPTSKMELFVTIIYSWKTWSCYSKYDFTVTVETVSVINSFWIELDVFFFCQTKVNFTKPGPLPTSKMELFVKRVEGWELLTSVPSSLDPPCINYDFQRSEEDCPNINYQVVYVNGQRPLFIFIPNPKCNQDFNETILETLSMSEKALKVFCCW